MTWDCIYLDPPWIYNQRSKGTEQEEGSSTKFGGGASARYPLMTDDELMAIAPLIKALAGKNASMHMWAVAPRLPFALQFMEACGFEFKTVEYVWVKLNKKWEHHLSKLPLPQALKKMVFKGTGAYTQSNVELVLLGVRGNIPIYVEKHGIRKPAQVVIAPHPRDEAGKIIHSRKPAVFRDLITQTRPSARKVELFCREAAPGWDVLGNDMDGNFDIKEALEWHLLLS